jgi:DNA polymerase III subunit beta
MKVEIGTKVLKNTLKIISKVKNNTMNPDLNNILVDVLGDVVTFIKSNNETTIIKSIPGFSYDNGVIILPEEMIDIIKKLSDDYIILSDEIITAGSKTIKFNHYNVRDYAYSSSINESLAFITTQKELHRMLEVKYAIGEDPTRPILLGICFNGNETCALDGYRLSKRKGEYSSNSIFVVNKNTIEILDNILKVDSEEPVEVYYDGSKVRFDLGNLDVIGETLTGEFIKYKSIIPEDFNYISTIESENLKKELGFIKGINSNILKMNFTQDNLSLIMDHCKEEYDLKASEDRTKELQEKAYEEYKIKYNIWAAKKKEVEKKKKPFKVKCPEEKIIRTQRVYTNVPVAEIKSNVSCHTKLELDKEEFRIAVNPKYLIEAASAYDGQVDFKMTNAVSPIVITQDGENLELVLPVRFMEVAR